MKSRGQFSVGTPNSYIRGIITARQRKQIAARSDSSLRSSILSHSWTSLRSYQHIIVNSCIFSDGDLNKSTLKHTALNQCNKARIDPDTIAALQAMPRGYSIVKNMGGGLTR